MEWTVLKGCETGHSRCLDQTLAQTVSFPCRLTETVCTQLLKEVDFLNMTSLSARHILLQLKLAPFGVQTTPQRS